LALDKQLNKVDFPTFGKPTIPHFNDMTIFFWISKIAIKPLFINNKIIRMESIIDNYIKTSLFLEGE